MNAGKMAKEGFYLVKSDIEHRYRQGWRFLTLREGFGLEEATWESFSALLLPERGLNSVLVDYLSEDNLEEWLRLAETLASQKKPRDSTLLIPVYICVSVRSLRTWAQAAEMVS